jgi:hypothetical protein
MRLKRGKTGDAVGRASWQSSFLGDAGANFFCETEQTGHDALEILPHPGLRFALVASPYGRRRASLRPGCGSCQGTKRTKITNPTSSEINLCKQKNGLDFGVHRRPIFRSASFQVKDLRPPRSSFSRLMLSPSRAPLGKSCVWEKSSMAGNSSQSKCH